jgi:hypothetical protein
VTTAADLCPLIHEILASLAAAELCPYLAEWPHAAVSRAVAPASLPVLRWLPVAAGDAPSFSAALIAALCHGASSLAWRQTYTLKDLGAEFLDNYGWSELVGQRGPYLSERIACGFLLLGPATTYPSHRHQAEEIYLPLSGTARWLQGDGLWQDKRAGTLIHHQSEEPHAMQTREQPLLALYLWRGGNLAEKSRFD